MNKYCTNCKTRFAYPRQELCITCHQKARKAHHEIGEINTIIDKLAYEINRTGTLDYVTNEESGYINGLEFAIELLRGIR